MSYRKAFELTCVIEDSPEFKRFLNFYPHAQVEVCHHDYSVRVATYEDVSFMGTTIFHQRSRVNGQTLSDVELVDIVKMRLEGYIS